jgi:hypothetical protein
MNVESKIPGASDQGLAALLRCQGVGADPMQIHHRFEAKAIGVAKRLPRHPARSSPHAETR